MSIRISVDTFHKLQKVAKKEKKTYSRKAREIIEEYLSNEDKSMKVIDTIEVPRELFEIMTFFIQTDPKIVSTLMFLFRRFIIWYTGLPLQEQSSKEILRVLNKFITEVLPDVTVSCKILSEKKSWVVVISSKNKKILSNVILFYTKVLDEFVKSSYTIVTRETFRVFIRIRL